MMTKVAIPDFAALLSPYISTIPAEALPTFLARLERTAADRYRLWADALPAHREGLLACAAREDEIADRIDAVYPSTDPLHIEKMDAAIKPAKATYYEIFAGLAIVDQLTIQANAERQGALAWRGIAATITDPAVIEQLQMCSALEETSADFLDSLLLQLAH